MGTFRQSLMAALVLDADFRSDPLVIAPMAGWKRSRTRNLLSFKADGRPWQPPGGCRLVSRSLCSSAPPYTLKIGDKFGLVDASFDPVTPVQFGAVVQAGRGVKNAKLDGKWGRIGSDGSWLLAPKFDYLSQPASIPLCGIDQRQARLHAIGRRLADRTEIRRRAVSRHGYRLRTPTRPGARARVCRQPRAAVGFGPGSCRRVRA